MINKKSNVILWIGLMGSLLIGASFITDISRVFWGNRNNWWTHQNMRIPIEETKNDFELYIGGKVLGKHISGGTLFSADKNGKLHTVVSKDVSVRLNNWDKIKASILMNTTISGFAFGITITLLLTGLIKALQRGKKF